MLEIIMLLNYKLFKNKNFGVTLVEVIVTVTIVALLTGLTIASMKTIKRPQELVDNATDVVENILNQANTSSITSNKPQDVCSLNKSSTTNNFATCNPDVSDWDNVNGSKFPKIKIKIERGTPKDKRPPDDVIPENIITYSLGLAPDSYKITISSIEKAACYNVINVWPNGVIDTNVLTADIGCMK